MSGLWRSNPTRWTPRQWAMAAVVMLAFGVAVFAAGRGLATGAMGEVLRLRFGGDAARTRVVVDLDRTSRGEVVQSTRGPAIRDFAATERTLAFPNDGLADEGVSVDEKMLAGLRIAKERGMSAPPIPASAAADTTEG